MPQEFNIQGRLVWGHPGKLQVKKDKFKQVVLNKEGKPVEQCSFGIAIDRNDFYGRILPLMQNEVRTAFPNAQPTQPNQLYPGGLMGLPQSFAWKFKDGDGPDHMGKPFNTREGYAGHVVLTHSTTGFMPKVYRADGRGGWVEMQPHEFKTGDFFHCKTSIKFNGASGANMTPGLYVNPEGLVHIGYGAEIITGADPDEMFAGMQVQQHAGMSAQPIAPTGAMPAGMAPSPQQYDQAPPQGYAAPAPQPQQYAPPPQQAPQQQYAPPPPQAPPASGFVQQAIAQPQQHYAPPPQQQPAPQAYQQPPQHYAQPPQGYAPPSGAAPQPQQQQYAPPQQGYLPPGMPAGR